MRNLVKAFTIAAIITVVLVTLLALDRHLNPQGMNSDWGIAKDNPIKMKR